MDFIEEEKIRRAKNIIDSMTRLPLPEDETYSIRRAIISKYDLHKPGFKLDNVPRWDDSLEKCEHVKLARQCTELGHDLLPGELLVPNWAWQRPLHGARDMSISTGAKGGYLVDTDIPFYDSLLRAQSVAFQSGVQLVEAGASNFAWPKQITASTPAWLSPGGSASSSSGTFVQISSTLKTIVSFIEVPISLLTQGGAAGEAFITDQLQKDLATAVDLAVLAGTGASGQPLGILNTVGIGTFSGTSLGYTGLVEAQTDVADNNAVLNPTTLRYVTTPTIAQTLKGRQRFTSTDSPLWKGAIHRGEIEGIPALSTKNMSASTVLYGDFSSVYVVQWGGLVLRVNPHQDFNRGYVGIRAMWMVDVVVRYPLSFSVATSVT